MFRFLNAILPYVFLITGFWKEGNGKWCKNFLNSISGRKSLIDQDIQSAHKALKNSSYILIVCIISNSKQINSFFTLIFALSLKFLFGNGILFVLAINFLFLEL